MTEEEALPTIQLVGRLSPLRYGQAIFNHAYEVAPDLADQVRSTEADCFYEDSRVPAFLAALVEAAAARPMLGAKAVAYEIAAVITTADEGSDLVEEIDEIAALVGAAEQRGAAKERERIDRQCLDRRDLMRHRSGGRHGNRAYADGYAMGLSDAAHIARGWDGLPSPPSVGVPS